MSAVSKAKRTRKRAAFFRRKAENQKPYEADLATVADPNATLHALWLVADNLGHWAPEYDPVPLANGLLDHRALPLLIFEDSRMVQEIVGRADRFLREFLCYTTFAHVTNATALFTLALGPSAGTC